MVHCIAPFFDNNLVKSGGKGTSSVGSSQYAISSFPQLCPSMQPVKNIIFDFGNVLFELDLPAIERNLKMHYGENFELAKEKLLRDKVFELYETGGFPLNSLSS